MNKIRMRRMKVNILALGVSCFMIMSATNVCAQTELIADAGADKSYVADAQSGMAMVTLDGGNSTGFDYVQWKLDGIKIANQLVHSLELAVSDQPYKFKLAAGTASKQWDYDTVFITVSEGVVVPVVVNAGEDQTVTADAITGLATVQLDASASAGNLDWFRWNSTGGPTQDGTNVTYTFGVGVHTNTLYVRETTSTSTNWFSDTMIVTVLDGSEGSEGGLFAADAGADVAVMLAERSNQVDVVLSGLNSLGDIVSWKWENELGILGASAMVTNSFDAGIYTNTLTVTSASGEVSSDEVIVEVFDYFFMLDAGPDQTVYDLTGNGSNLVTLSAIASSSDIAWVQWKLGENVLGTDLTIDTELPLGEHEISLWAKHKNAASSTCDTVTINVLDSGPVAVVEGDFDVFVPDLSTNATFEIRGDQSYHISENSYIDFYSWREGIVQVGVGSNATVTLPLGKHIIKLSVFDELERYSSDEIVVNVKGLAPVANAGGDQTAAATTFNGSASVTLVGTNSFDYNNNFEDDAIEDGNFVWSVAGNSYTGAIVQADIPVGIYTNVLTVTDNDGYTNSDEAVVIVNQPLDSSCKNVLFISVDDLRPELGVYGNGVVRSPNIDRLANRGTRFNRAYCQLAVCAPSRSSMMSGARPDTTKIYSFDNEIRDTMPNVLTLCQYYKEMGYKSVSLGKIYHHKTEDKEGWTADPWRSSNSAYLTEESRQQIIGSYGPATERANVGDYEYPDGDMVTNAIATLQHFYDEEKPFFLGVGFTKPHLPFNAPEKYWALYDGDVPYETSITNWPVNMPDYAETTWGELRNYTDIPSAATRLSGDLATRLTQGYYACVSYVDSLIGELLEAVDTNNTIIVLWADHGYKLNDYGAWGKETNFEVDTHIPMIIVDSRYPSGQVVNGLVELVDIYPTLVDLCGFGVPPHCEGRSMVPLLEEPSLAWKEGAFSQYYKGYQGHSLRTTNEWRYTEWYNAAGVVDDLELYDQYETTLVYTNLAYEEGYDDQCLDLNAVLDAGKGWVKVRDDLNRRLSETNFTQ